MISFGHIVVILVVVLLLFGPSRLEKLGPSLGKAIRGFKKGIETGKDLDEEDEEDSDSKPKKLSKKKPTKDSTDT